MSDTTVLATVALLLTAALMGLIAYLVTPWARVRGVAGSRAARRRAAAIRARLAHLRATEPQRPDPRELAAGAARLTAAAHPHGRHAARIPTQRTGGR